MRKTLISIILIISIIITPMCIDTSAYIAQEGANWAAAQIGTAIDFDGIYGAQCVDLTMQYCNYLFGWTPHGNASDYISVALPAQWQRIQYYAGFVPNPGDIVVFIPGAKRISSYGHVGIVLSANTSSFVCAEQNVNSIQRVQSINHSNYANVWGIIRPPFSSPVPPAPTAFCSSSSASGITKTGVKIGSAIINNNRNTITQWKITVWDSAENVVIDYSENVPAAHQNILNLTIWYDTNVEGAGIQLKPGTHYKALLRANANNQSIESNYFYFDTLPDNPVFTDIAKNHWAYSSVLKCSEQGLINGISEKEFGPNYNLTRGMLATILYRLNGSPETDSSSDFTDVDNSIYYANPIKWASDNSVVNGMGNNLFAPDNNITREQLAVMLYNYAKKFNTASESTSLSGFSDQNKVSYWAQDALRWAAAKGIIQGKNDNILDPGGLATRAEAACMLARFTA